MAVVIKTMGMKATVAILIMAMMEALDPVPPSVVDIAVAAEIIMTEEVTVKISSAVIQDLIEEGIAGIATKEPVRTTTGVLHQVIMDEIT